MSNALVRMLQRSFVGPLISDDFKRDYGDSRFGRFILYLLAYSREAQDWDAAGHRLGFGGGALLSDYWPQWHHIFPRKFLAGKVGDSDIDMLANIAVIGSVIGPTVNMRISDKDPMNYLVRYPVGDEKLRRRLIDPAREPFTTSHHPTFLKKRADALATEANRFWGISAVTCPLRERHPHPLPTCDHGARC